MSFCLHIEQLGQVKQVSVDITIIGVTYLQRVRNLLFEIILVLYYVHATCKVENQGCPVLPFILRAPGIYRVTWQGLLSGNFWPLFIIV